jgi:cytochrome c
MRAVLTVVAGTCLLAACGPAPADHPANPIEPASAPTAAAAPMTDAEQAAALAALPAPYNAADLDNGQRKFALCRSCHMITPNGGNLTGPNLHGVFGRRAGSVATFNYSQAVRNAGFTWDAQHLDNWLSNPRTFLPGTKMTFAGIHDPTDRRDLIAYLMVESAPRTPAHDEAHEAEEAGENESH